MLPVSVVYVLGGVLEHACLQDRNQRIILCQASIGGVGMVGVELKTQKIWSSG